MYKMKKKYIVIILMLIACMFVLLSCGDTEKSKVKYSSPLDLEGSRVGIGTGTNYDSIAKDYWKNPQLVYLNSFTDLIPALTSNKIDCFLSDEPWIRYLASSNPEVTYLEEKITKEDYGLIFAKTNEGEALRDEFNEFLAQLSESGELQEMQNSWFGGDESNYAELDYASLPAINGTICVNTSVDNPPFEFYVNGKIVGYNIELLYGFCKSRGYELKITDMNFDSLIAGITSGKYDIASSSFAMTKERMEAVNFSDAVYQGGTVVAIRTSDAANIKGGEEESSFAQSIVSSLEKTFIRENRWTMFLYGSGVTLLITILSILFGTALGFGTYMWYRQGSKLSEKVMDFFSWLITGMPEVLLLLILFYIVFGKTSLSGIWVSIIAFTMVMGIGVFGMFKSGVAAVDNSQMEAALALGYSPNFAFFKMILPQALQHILPNYRGSIVSLIKSTAIVGYVAVQDLTKISDIVRSRTFEPFFPLIVTAVIYFIMAWILLFLVNKIQINLLPIRRSKQKILKGLNTGVDEVKK